MNRLFIYPLLATALFCGSVSFATTEEVVAVEEAPPFPEVVRVEEPELPVTDVTDSITEQVGNYYNPEDAYLYRVHNDTYYHIFAYSASGDVVQLHDGSSWAVHPSDQYIVHGWAQSDNLFIKPQSSWFSSYKYVLQNYTTQQSVDVDLIIAPPSFGVSTFHIVNIDYYNRLVFLSDNTVWQVDAWDYNFNNYMIGQRVMIGLDNYWPTATLPNILINVDLYGVPYSRANFYGYPVGY